MAESVYISENQNQLDFLKLPDYYVIQVLKFSGS